MLAVTIMPQGTQLAWKSLPSVARLLALVWRALRAAELKLRLQTWAILATTEPLKANLSAKLKEHDFEFAEVAICAELLHTSQHCTWQAWEFFLLDRGRRCRLLAAGV